MSKRIVSAKKIGKGVRVSFEDVLIACPVEVKKLRVSKKVRDLRKESIDE